MDNTREKLIEIQNLSGLGEKFEKLLVTQKQFAEKMKLIDLLTESEILCNDCGQHGNSYCIEAIADHLIANGVTVQKWIPVTERLPDISDLDKEWSKTVLFRTTQGYILSGYRHIGRPQKSFYDDDWTTPYWLNESEEVEFEDDEVTHWMPLPEPPKEG